jgi:hypothetical protein
VIRMTRQVLVSFALIAVLSLSLAAAWAQSQPQPSQPQSTPGSRANGLGGTIASVSDGAFVLTTRDGRSVTVRTTASYDFATFLLHNCSANKFGGSQGAGGGQVGYCFSVRAPQSANPSWRASDPSLAA